MTTIKLLRAAFIIAFLALFGQATGYFAYSGGAGASCSQPCPDDDEDGRCPPDCGFCTCCAHTPSVTTVAHVVRYSALVSRLRFHAPESFPTSTEPAAIFKVPKLFLA